MPLLRIQLEWFHPWPNNVGPYLARRLGLLDDGIEFGISVGDAGRGDGLAALERREADLAYVPTNRLLARREAGAAIVGVAAVNHRPLEAVMTLADRGISRPRDLTGRRVAFVASLRLEALLRAIVADDGGDPARIEVVHTGVREPTLATVAAGEADAAWGGLWAWEALLDGYPPEERVVFPAGEAGGPSYHAYVLAVREDLAEDRPDELRQALAAIGEGYRRAAADPDLAAEAIEAAVPIFPRDLFLEAFRLLAPTWTHEGRWGLQREDELLAPYARWLAERGLLRSPSAWRGAVTNEFVP